LFKFNTLIRQKNILEGSFLENSYDIIKKGANSLKYLLFFTTLLGPLCLAKSQNIALLGDSMGAGTFAGAEPASFALNEKHPITQWLVKALFNQPRYGFFSGDRVNSLAERLRIETGEDVAAYNLAVAGATIKDVLTEQLPELYRVYSKHGTIDKTFIFIGANDLCSQTKNYSDAMEWVVSISSQLSKRVYLVPLPSVHEVWRVQDKRNILGLKATTVWKLTGICARMTLDGERYFAANSRWRNKWNETLKLHGQTYGATYVSSMERMPFDPSFVGRIDMFHSSRKGNEALAEAIWRHVE
jgi:lysophospholipase L1-like esterase